MDSENNWRISLARHVGSAYQESEKVSSVLIGGSVALGVDDKYSDLDLIVFWDQPPSESDREKAVLRSGGIVDVNWSDPPTNAQLKSKLLGSSGRIGQIWPYESNEWSDHFYIGDVNIGVSGFLSSTVSQYLKEISGENDISDDMQIIISAIVEGTPLSGIEVIEVWKEAAANFPESLARILINKAIAYDDSWSACDVFAERHNRFVLQGLISHMADKVVRALLALNGIYLPDPRHKWLDFYSERMAWKPDEFLPRLVALTTATPSFAVHEIEALFLETLDLVDLHLPGADTGFARDWINYRRLVIRQNPFDWLDGQ